MTGDRPAARPMPTPADPVGRPAVVLDTRVADRAGRRSSSWSLEHLRWCWLALAVVTLVLAAIAAPVSGAGAAWAAVLGGGIVGAFFSLSSWFVARVGRVSTRAMLPAALAVYLVEIVALGVVLSAVPRDGFLDVRWLAGAVVLGLVVWLGTHLRHVWTAKVFYVDPS